jgi:hypothetical protein
MRLIPLTQGDLYIVDFPNRGSRIGAQAGGARDDPGGPFGQNA